MKEENPEEEFSEYPVLPVQNTPIDISTAQIAEANTLHKKFIKCMKKGAMTAFEIGKILREIWSHLNAYDS